MTINALDHVNIASERLIESVAFYVDVIGLESRDPPAPVPPDRVRWLCDRAGRPIIHLMTTDMIERDRSATGDTGALDHVALDCSGHDEMVARLDRLGIGYQSNHVASIDLRQIFVADPNGVLLELNYRAG